MSPATHFCSPLWGTEAPQPGPFPPLLTGNTFSIRWSQGEMPSSSDPFHPCPWSRHVSDSHDFNRSCHATGKPQGWRSIFKALTHQIFL